MSTIHDAIKAAGSRCNQAGRPAPTLDDPDDNEDRIQFPLILSRDLHAALGRRAHAEGTSKAEVARTALAQYLKKERD